MNSPIICLGQQPCGFFPKRFLVSKFQTAKRMQSEMGGEIVFFYHDSDHDPRETRTTIRHRKTNEPAQLNFTFENKNQRKFSPLYLKRIPDGWQSKTTSQLPNYVEHSLIDIFKSVSASTVADFCLEMYTKMGLLDGIKVVRSSSPEFRSAACDIDDFFVDVPYEGEVVRARFADDTLSLHEGGDVFVKLPQTSFTKEQISPSRDTRLRWMQSVLHCTHYVAGEGEQAYLKKDEAPEITFVTRDTIDRSDEGYIELPEKSPLLIFGAHPDDIEFGCGGVVALETKAGRPVHFVVCSRGEAASNGTPEQREQEARKAAAILGATIEFIEFAGDSHLELRPEYTVRLAELIRRIEPFTVMAPTCVENQHPDHSRLGKLVRDAARLARYGGLPELRGHKPHVIGQLFFYAVTPEGEPCDASRILIDISAPDIVSVWTEAMNAHVSQASTRNYIELQLTRARLAGASAGVEYATTIFPNEPLIFQSLMHAGQGARRF